MANVIPLATPLAYGIKDFARLAGFSVRTLYSLWQEGKGPPRKRIGGRIIITHTDGAAWLARQETA
jgi:hypothetical protein